MEDQLDPKALIDDRTRGGQNPEPFEDAARRILEQVAWALLWTEAAHGLAPHEVTLREDVWRKIDDIDRAERVPLGSVVMHR
jgi:hypothetical protein